LTSKWKNSVKLTEKAEECLCVLTLCCACHIFVPFHTKTDYVIPLCSRLVVLYFQSFIRERQETAQKFLYLNLKHAKQLTRRCRPSSAPA